MSSKRGDGFTQGIKNSCAAFLVFLFINPPPLLAMLRALNCHHQYFIFLFVHNLKHQCHQVKTIISYIQGYNGDEENLGKGEKVSWVFIFHINLFLLLYFLSCYSSYHCYKMKCRRLAYMLLSLLFNPFNWLIHH